MTVLLYTAGAILLFVGIPLFLGRFIRLGNT